MPSAVFNDDDATVMITPAAARAFLGSRYSSSLNLFFAITIRTFFPDTFFIVRSPFLIYKIYVLRTYQTA